MKRQKNTYFQFKKFRIDQDNTSMKVCTDSCVLGAIAAQYPASKILDIGTGTGLLALMIAQKNSGVIDAVELEVNAYNQAKENISNSLWAERINIYQDNIFIWAINEIHHQQYDLIVCNPPFFDDHLVSPDDKWNSASHQGFDHSDFFKLIYSLLKKSGQFLIMLPPIQMNKLKDTFVQKGLFSNKEIRIFDKINGKQIRTISEFESKQKIAVINTLTIADETGNYTEAFKELLKDYYLHL